MLRLAICHYSFHRRYEAEGWTPLRLAEEVKALGVEAVDFHVRYLGDPGSAPDRIAEAIDATELALAGLSLSNNFNVEDEGDFAGQVESVKSWIAVAGAVGAPVSRIFGGHLADRTDADARKAAMPRIARGLEAVLPAAEAAGVVLALENHGGLPCTGEEQAETIAAFDSPWLKATVDVGNYMQGGQEGADGARVAAPHCAYIHLKDFRKIPGADTPWGWGLEACTVGRGDVDIPACLRAVRDAGFAGFVGLEYEGAEDEATGVPESVAYAKSVLDALG